MFLRRDLKTRVEWEEYGKEAINVTEPGIFLDLLCYSTGIWNKEIFSASRKSKYLVHEEMRKMAASFHFLLLVSKDCLFQLLKNKNNLTTITDYQLLKDCGEVICIESDALHGFFQIHSLGRPYVYTNLQTDTT